VVKGIGHKIRAARFNKGKEWTQKRLADQAGLSQGYISAIERGDEFPSLKALKRIGEVLDAPLGYFIDELDDVDAPLTEAKTSFKRTNHGDSLDAVKENLAAIFEEMLREKAQAPKNNKGVNIKELQDEVVALKKRVSSIESSLKRSTKQ
jgi:transcriptional regulator with XRE-family HTH domain